MLCCSFFSPHIEVDTASSSRDGMELMEINAIFSLFTSLKMTELVEIHAKQFSSEKPVVPKLYIVENVKTGQK